MNRAGKRDHSASKFYSGAIQITVIQRRTGQGRIGMPRAAI